MEFMVEEAPEQELQQSSDSRVHVVAGACAGLMEHCGMFPIDTIKVGPGGGGKKPRCGAWSVVVLYGRRKTNAAWRG